MPQQRKAEHLESHGEHKPATALVAGVVIGVIAGVGMGVGAYMNSKKKAEERAREASNAGGHGEEEAQLTHTHGGASTSVGTHKLVDHEGNSETYNPLVVTDADSADMELLEVPPMTPVSPSSDPFKDWDPDDDDPVV
jgi:hypothetical protein